MCSPIVHVDGPRSVEAAFAVGEISSLASRGGMDGAVITHHWPQRGYCRGGSDERRADDHTPGGGRIDLGRNRHRRRHCRGDCGARISAMRCRVLLVERESFPRAKVCGGCLNGLRPDALSSLGLDDVLAAAHAAPVRSFVVQAARRVRWSICPPDL